MTQSREEAMCAGCAQGAGYLLVDFSRCAASDIFTAYEEFGVLCANGPRPPVLLKTGKEDGDVHYALRDALLTVAAVGEAPLGMKVALVATSGAIRQVGAEIEPELLEVGCSLRMFSDESAAARWLGAGPGYLQPVSPAALPA